MRREATAMLQAVTHDCSRIPEIHVTVFLSAEVAGVHASSANGRSAAPHSADRILCADGALPDQIARSVRAGDLLFLIAPECDDALRTLLVAVESLQVPHLQILNLDSRRSALFADKLQTCRWLEEHGIPTIPTQVFLNQDAGRIHWPSGVATETLTGSHSFHDQAERSFVVKPRFGAGCTNVRCLRATDFTSGRMDAAVHDSGHLIVQPWISGTPCSIGFIGGGEVRSTVTLPPGQQLIRQTGTCLSYHGGIIPCSPPFAEVISPLAEALMQALGAFHGYVGADLIVDPDSSVPVRVVEVNPRLCTSYVGYRALAEDNLARWLLQQPVDSPLRWKSGPVRFDADGRTQFI